MLQIDPVIESELKKVTAQSCPGRQCGALIVRDGKILSSGYAHDLARGTAGEGNEQLLAHAEESVLLDALNKQVDVTGADIYVLLVRPNGEVRFTDASYSCVTCSRLLKQTKLSGVIYPVPGGWARDAVEEMFDKAVERVTEGD